MHRMNRQGISAEHAAAADDHLELIHLVKMRADDPLRHAFGEKGHRRDGSLLVRHEKIRAPCGTGRRFALGPACLDILERCNLRHVISFARSCVLMPLDCSAGRSRPKIAPGRLAVWSPRAGAARAAAKEIIMTMRTRHSWTRATTACLACLLMALPVARGAAAQAEKNQVRIQEVEVALSTA